MKRNEIIRFLILRTLGNFLVLFGLYGVVTMFGPIVSYEVQYRVIQFRGIHYSVSEQHIENANTQKNSGAKTFGDFLAGDTKQLLMPSDPLFSILIPKIGATAKIFPNVDSQDSGAFSTILSQGVAHAKGSVFPGNKGNIYLFAHSAANWWDAGKYNALFYLLNHLEAQDEIAIFFENKRFTYIVTKKEILEANDTRYLNQPHGGEEQLVLQTCWPPGTTWKRMYVIAERKIADGE